MATDNKPIARVLTDSDYTVSLSITGQYTSAQTATNTTVLVANTVQGANTSRLCLLDVVTMQFTMATLNGWASLEFANTGGANVTIASFGKGQASILNGYFTNPNQNINGDINLRTSNLDANDAYNIIVTLRKNNFNDAYANIALKWDTPQH